MVQCNHTCERACRQHLLHQTKSSVLIVINNVVLIKEGRNQVILLIQQKWMVRQWMGRDFWWLWRKKKKQEWQLIPLGILMKSKKILARIKNPDQMQSYKLLSPLWEARCPKLRTTLLYLVLKTWEVIKGYSSHIGCYRSSSLFHHFTTIICIQLAAFNKHGLWLVLYMGTNRYIYTHKRTYIMLIHFLKFVHSINVPISNQWYNHIVTMQTYN